MDIIAGDMFIGKYSIVEFMEDTRTFLHEDDDIDRLDAMIRKVFSLIFPGCVILAYQQVGSIAEASLDCKRQAKFYIVR